MTSNFQRVATLLVAALMLTSVLAVGGVAAATTTAESDLTDTETTEAEITDNVIVDFNASDEQSTTVIVETEQTFDADALDDADVTLEDWDTLAINVSDDGVEHHETVAVDEDDADISLTDTTGDVPAEAEFVIDHDDLATLPGDAGGSTIGDLTIEETFEDVDHVDADEDDMVDIETEFVAEFEFDTSYASVYVDEPDDSDTIEPGILSSFNVFSDADDRIVQSYDETVGINGSETTVTVHDATDDGSEAFDEAMDDLDSGDVAFGAAAAVDADPVMVFYESADSDLVDEDEDTFVVYDGDSFEVNLGEDYEDDEEIDVYVDSQNALEADLDAADVGALYADDFSMMDLQGEFGILNTMWDLGIGPFGVW